MRSTIAIAEEERASFVETCFFLFMSKCNATSEGFAQVCVFLFIVLSSIQDFMLQGTPLRSLGASPCIFPLFALALLEGAKWLFSAKPRVSRSVQICFAYVVLTALYGLLVFGVTSHGENLFWKGTTSFVSLLAFLYATQLDYSKTSVVRTAIYVALALVIVGFMFGNSNPLRLPAVLDNGVLHFMPLNDERPRGLATEPSELSMTAITIGLLAVYLTKSRARKVLLFLVIFGVLFASGSKGGILTLFICVMILSLMKWHSKWHQVLGLLFVLFPLGLILIWLVPTLFPEESLALSGTIPTRFSMIICALMTVIHHPLGVGMTGFLPAVAKYLPNAMSTLESIFNVPLYFGEVSGYLESADAVGTKTFFFDQLMRFGIPFAVAFIVFIVGLVKRLAARRETVLLTAILASTVAIMTYQPGTGNFAISIVFGLALRQARA